ncbi:NUDIX domain-containing protein [Hazenella sp. IB182357]|uniref:NUDIX domain-containing protein n=1 Tax=Polycladospora coralii TaxID=2771432 RepID=A0A926NA63_9BACL|nr:NUDIX domain-containing protein [Polycladospora coralii]MBD1372267.1 NUDIX domain-containing protein [Polycladospora coralii]MBS7530766.1 NUDIX domain-containing protein [Polycladospora coralii]
MRSDAPIPNTLVPAASGIVLNKKGNILLHKRSDNHLWSLPGSVMELGETIEQTIIREVKEETGFDVVVKKCVGIYTDPRHIIAYTDGEVRQQFSICFECNITKDELRISNESTQIDFFTFDEVEKLELHPAQRISIDDFHHARERAYIR